MLTMILSLMMTLTINLISTNSNTYEFYVEDTYESQSISILDFVAYHQNLKSASVIYSTLMQSYACHSGGDGASSCKLGLSLLGCSVSCEEGYVACCSFWYGCKCIKKDSPSDEPEVEDGTVWV